MVRKIFLIMLLLFVGFALYWFKFRTTAPHIKDPKLTPMALKKHSELFNKSVDSLVSAYLDIKNAFVEADTAAARKATVTFIDHLDHFPIDEMKKDTSMVLATVEGNLTDIKRNAVSLLNQTDLTEMRKDFSSVTEQMYPSFFTAINYEGPTLYFENCPMAFGENNAANWISNSAEIVNPYMGKKHPQYKATMLGCGEVKDSIMAK